MKFATLHYDHPTMNLGDVIQSLAVEQFLPCVDASFDRDGLGALDTPDSYTVVMNGWFTTRPDQWPPAGCIRPIFFGFHLNSGTGNVNEAVLFGSSSIDYLKRHQPIGCRDPGTEKRLRALGVDTYYSRCLSLTFARRDATPPEPKVFLVDITPGDVYLPHAITAKGVSVTHTCDHRLADGEKRRLATELLDRYRNEATLVVTTRLHCALPCIAMGVPVVFFGWPDEARLGILAELGLRLNRFPRRPARWLLRCLHRLREFTRGRSGQAVSDWLYHTIGKRIAGTKVNWQPRALDIRDRQASIKQRITAVIDAL